MDKFELVYSNSEKRKKITASIYESDWKLMNRISKREGVSLVKIFEIATILGKDIKCNADTNQPKTMKTFTVAKEVRDMLDYGKTTRADKIHNGLNILKQYKIKDIKVSLKAFEIIVELEKIN